MCVGLCIAYVVALCVWAKCISPSVYHPVDRAHSLWVNKPPYLRRRLASERDLGSRNQRPYFALSTQRLSISERGDHMAELQIADLNKKG